MSPNVKNLSICWLRIFSFVGGFYQYRISSIDRALGHVFRLQYVNLEANFFSSVDYIVRVGNAPYIRTFNSPQWGTPSLSKIFRLLHTYWTCGVLVIGLSLCPIIISALDLSKFLIKPCNCIGDTTLLKFCTIFWSWVFRKNVKHENFDPAFVIWWTDNIYTRTK